MKSKKGLTLIELLVVVIILGALVAIAIPRMSSSSAQAERRACQSNQNTIDTQVELYYMNNSSTWPSWAQLTSDANYFPDGAPVCPSGGNYTLDGTTHRVSCSYSGH
jgi:prepilin-type N-terminal cleavage/methylation domain-containing protein